MTEDTRNRILGMYAGFMLVTSCGFAPEAKEMWTLFSAAPGVYDDLTWRNFIAWTWFVFGPLAVIGIPLSVAFFRYPRRYLRVTLTWATVHFATMCYAFVTEFYNRYHMVYHTPLANYSPEAAAEVRSLAGWVSAFGPSFFQLLLPEVAMFLLLIRSRPTRNEPPR